MSNITLSKRLLAILLYLYLVPANATDLHSASDDTAYACMYMLNKGGFLLEGMPEPCKAFTSPPARMVEKPVLRALQIYIESTRSQYSQKDYLQEFMQLPSATWSNLAKDTYFMFGMHAAMLESFRSKNEKGITRPGHSEFIRSFYQSALTGENANGLGNVELTLGTFAAWLMLHNDHDLAIDALEKLKSVSRNHNEEHATYFSIFSHANLLKTPGGLEFLVKMKSHFGEMDWRTVYPLYSAVMDMDRSPTQFLPYGAREHTPDPTVDMWSTIQAWIKSDIISTAPDAGVSIMMGQATRYYRSKQYDKAMEIVEYVLKSHAEEKLHERDSHAFNARSLGAEIIISRKQYDQLRPYFDRHGGSPKVTRSESM